MRVITTIGIASLLAVAATAQSSNGYFRLGYNSVTKDSVFDSEAKIGQGTLALVGPGGSSASGFVLGYGQTMPCVLIKGATAGWEVNWLRNGSGNRFDSYTGQWRVRFDSGEKFYGGVGLGFGYHQISTAAVSATGYRFLGTAYVGYDFDKFGFELTYWYSGKLAAQNLDRWTASIVMRF